MMNEEMMTETKWYQSSAGTGNISLTIKGVLVALVPIIIALLSSQGYAVDESVVVQFIEQVTTAVASVLVLFGVVRKIYYAYNKESY